MNKPKRRIETNLPLVGSTALNGLLKRFAIANYLQTNLYNLKEKGERRKEKGRYSYEFIFKAIASAALIPSTAEETIPPA